MRIIAFSLGICVLLSACEERTPPRSVESFIDNRSVLDSTLLRCNADRDRTLADPECINARKAVARISAREEQGKKARLEAESERKRDQLRRQREARDRILADRRERDQAETAAKEMAEFTGSTDLPSTADPDAVNAGDMANRPADPAAQLPAGAIAATVARPAVVTPETVTDGRKPVATTPPENAAATGTGEQTLTPDPLTPTTQPPEQPPAVTDPVSANTTSDDDLEAEIQRLEAELRKRREAEIRRLEEELRLRKQQNDTMTD